MTERRTVLVTGSSGRVGQAIGAHLVEAGWVVRGLDQRPGRLTTRLGNVTDSGSLEDTVPGVDAVVHTASLHAPHVGQVADAKFRQVNVEGTEALLGACRRHGVRRVVYTSTTSLYGQAMVAKGRAVWVDEDLEPRPRDIYDETKLAAESLCRQAHGPDLAVFCLRISRCFPEPLRMMSIYRLYRGVDLGDVAAAHRLALDAALGPFQPVNVSAQSPFTRDDLVALFVEPMTVVERYLPWAPEEFRRRGWEPPKCIDRVYDIARARQLLGYAPARDFPTLFGRDEPVTAA